MAAHRGGIVVHTCPRPAPRRTLGVRVLLALTALGRTVKACTAGPHHDFAIAVHAAHTMHDRLACPCRTQRHNRRAAPPILVRSHSKFAATAHAVAVVPPVALWVALCV